MSLREDVEAALAAAADWPADTTRPGTGPLAGVRVLDCSRVLAGPFAGMVLSDLGADVIKVERPGHGDDTRRWGPPFHGDDAAYFLSVNRNRRSLTLDLADEAGQAILAHLAAGADVVLENFLPRHARSLGIDRLRDATPDTVWVSIRGAGTDGPDGDLPGYDVMVQARSGLMGITGFPSTGPTKVGVAIADVITGLYAAVSALAGLLGRQGRAPGRTDGDDDAPRAPRIEVPLLESAISALVNQAANHLVGGQVPGPLGNDHPNIAPYGPVHCADRPLVVGAGNDRQFVALCRAVDRDDLADDPRFATNADRVEHREALTAALAATFASDTADAWRQRLGAAGVPCAPVNRVDEVFADPQVQAVGLVEEVAHPAGAVPQVRSPLRVDGVRAGVRRAPPVLGQHTEAVLGTLGLDAGLVDALRDAGVC